VLGNDSWQANTQRGEKNTDEEKHAYVQKGVDLVWGILVLPQKCATQYKKVLMKYKLKKIQ